MTDIEFRMWPKTPRLFRDMIITEKLDGTNSAIGIVPLAEDEWASPHPAIFHVLRKWYPAGDNPTEHYGVYAQSRKRLIAPGKTTDNYGFAAWVAEHASSLFSDLGVGLHFGEWWGNGIQRGYGLPKDDKRFSLFNVSRYGGKELITPGLATVPVLWTGPFDTADIGIALASLELNGSLAAPGFMRPEGIVVYHTAANHTFKVTVENDDQPKGQDA